MLVTLIGYRGSGKSTVGGVLAGRLGWLVVDADAEIERVAGKTIREIFAQHGEGQFREQEREIMVELLGRDRIVLAAGGGAVLHPETRRDLRRAGPVVWLRASVETIWQRISGDGTTAARRPNLTAAGGREEIAQLLAVREPLYRECATLTVETDGRTADEIADDILRALAPQLDEGARA